MMEEECTFDRSTSIEYKLLGDAARLLESVDNKSASDIVPNTNIFHTIVTSCPSPSGRIY